MAVNLSRNTKVLFSTVVGATAIGQFTSANTTEIQVLDGYTFSQNTEQQTINLSEAGTNPIRGERAFNSKLNPVDWSLNTYIRPYKSTNVKAPESLLWNAMLGYKPVSSTLNTCTGTATISGSTATGFLSTITHAAHTATAGDSIKVSAITGLSGSSTGNGIFRVVSTATNTITYSLDTYVSPTGTAASAPQYQTGQWYESTASSVVTAQGSNVNKLQPFSLVFLVDNSVYIVDNCAVNQAEVTFDLAGIAMIAWSGMGTTLTDRSAWAFTAGSQYTVFPASPVPQFITNKLSTVTLSGKLGGNDGSAGTSYTIPITGGNLTINNNIEFLTPEVLGVVNTPIGYFTGSRAISGSLNAYLKTGTNETSTLMSDILTGLATTSETKFKLQVEIGGLSNTTRVEALMNYCQLQVPTVDVQDVIATTINFTAQGGKGTTSATAYDQNYAIEATNNLQVSYYTP